nr:hypothetical protein [Tanacetum cinerariifolium]
KKVKVKDYEYYKTKMLLAKKDKDEQVLLAKNQALMESCSDSDQEINPNMIFMAPIEKVLSESEASSSSADEKISEASYYLSKESKSESEFETSEYYDNSTNYASSSYGLLQLSMQQSISVNIHMLGTFNRPTMSRRFMPKPEILSKHSTDEIYLGQNESSWASDGKALEAFEEFGKKLISYFNNV